MLYDIDNIYADVGVQLMFLFSSSTVQAMRARQNQDDDDDDDDGWRSQELQHGGHTDFDVTNLL